MESFYSNLNLNSSDIFEFEPDPIQSYSKLDQVSKFQRQEYAREQNRKNEPSSTRVLEVVTVIVFITLLLILLLVYLRVCHKSYKSPAANGKYTLHGGKWIVVAQNANPEREAGMSLFVPTPMELPPMPMKSVKCSKPACVCAFGGNGSKGQRVKGWRRNSNDVETYGPAKI